MGLPQAEQLLDRQAPHVVEIAHGITDPDDLRARQALVHHVGGVRPNGAKPLNDDGHPLQGRHAQVPALGQHVQPRHLLQQGVQRNDESPRRGPELVNAVAAHIGGFRDHALQPILDGNRLHVRVVGPHIWPRQVQVPIM